MKFSSHASVCSQVYAAHEPKLMKLKLPDVAPSEITRNYSLTVNKNAKMTDANNNTTVNLVKRTHTGPLVTRAPTVDFPTYPEPFMPQLQSYTRLESTVSIAKF
jgi:hypothetical protein